MQDLESRDLSADVRGMQILCGALMMGILSFAGVSLLLVNGMGIQVASEILMPAVLAGISIMSIGPTQMVARMTTMHRPGYSDIGDFISQYRGGSLISWAGLEGAAFMNLTAYIIGGQWWSLTIPGLALMWMAATFPTESKLRVWLRSRLEQLEIEGS